MAELKTKRNELSVDAFIDSISDEIKRNDSRELVELMSRVTKTEPAMWGDSIIGFGSYDYKYESGREGTWFRVGFSPRKQNLTLYLMDGFEKYDDLLSQLGKHTTGKSCLYVKKLEDVDLKVLTKMVRESFKAATK
ncbi:MAG: DUF1801 domain-containing protein [Acidimicrobiia bacterium]|nr:DUF1801 domain-containing protein [Acidimicrobiia bacterium]MBT8249065.1 DUF1801 domain-containing protein [Acidimicrobiia bacterium]NNC43566.1 DUF1801 domain-containing protein [Acidimicrobiia bacterium]NNL27237.1 DUF1801 domain-containing protein [Acidimicrobiia bacterium]